MATLKRAQEAFRQAEARLADLDTAFDHYVAQQRYGLEHLPSESEWQHLVDSFQPEAFFAANQEYRKCREVLEACALEWLKSNGMPDHVRRFQRMLDLRFNQEEILKWCLELH